MVTNRSPSMRHRCWQEGGYGSWEDVVYPHENACGSIELPSTKEEFVETAKRLGIDWNIEEVADSDDLKWF